MVRLLILSVTAFTLVLAGDAFAGDKGGNKGKKDSKDKKSKNTEVTEKEGQKKGSDKE